ncbi:FAD-dependent monooxygenase [Mycolicibacterium goodii]|uniref:FAD-dependent oxidoreductase n=1 Tax=Mycolicibacterium goodii TaxID=134601 RepID=A0A0K0XDR7_MYCGD|nr:FAD-dependent oxidoreductase [Mycolicibacterium goodii]
MNTPDRADVVIAGAGPNGLLLAGELALAGVRPVVLEQLTGPSPELRANGIVGQVHRALDMRGLYQMLTGSGAPPQPLNGYIFAGMHVPFTGVVDNPMYGMFIKQPQVVRRLADWARDLGVQIRWGHALTDVATQPGGVELDVESPQGAYRLDATYLVGADGGRSMVRKTMGIGFPGVTSPVVARVAHVSIPDRLRVPGALDIPGIGRIPFGHNRFDRGVLIYMEFEPGRSMIGTIEYTTLLPDDAPAMTVAELQGSVTRILGVEVPITPPTGPGPHALRRINGQNTRQAERYRVGNVFLIGDAAHVHSAVGGPGLNLGMQDAMNLGWKLAAAVHGWAPPGLLDTYHSERHPAGERVMMQSMAQHALLQSGPEVDALRTLFGELLATSEGATHIAHLLAGADVRYDVADPHPLSGSMAPEMVFDDGRRLADLMRAGRPVLLDLDGGEYAATALDWRDRVDLVTPATAADRPAPALLIRPDGYVAWAATDSSGDDHERLGRALGRWFGDQHAGLERAGT